MQKILINGLQLGDENTGVQYYTKNLYEELNKIETENFKFHLIRSPVSSQLSICFRSSKNNRLKRICFENFFLPAYLRKNNYDLYHSPNYVLPYFLYFPSVLTIHDLITLNFPQFCQFKSVLYFRLFLPNSIKKATKIIAVSYKVKEDILRRFNIYPDKIEVVYQGVNPIFKKIRDKGILSKTRDKYYLPDQFLLFVGNIEPKKNLVRLIKAFDILRKTTELKHKLVIVGKKGWKYNSVFKTIYKLKIGNEIIFTGYVPEEDLPAIYSMADLFVFPSLYEGFGIPPLEAMACETPVLVSNKGALPETTGGKCLQVNPYDINDIAKGINTLLTDEALRTKTIENCKKWVKDFTWERAARQTIKVYERILFRDVLRKSEN